MFLSKAAFGLCLLFLICTLAAQVVAARNGDKRRVHALRFISLGLLFSAGAYLFHILGTSPGSPLSLLSLVFRLVGISLLWLGWINHWKMQREYLTTQTQALNQEKDDGPTFKAALPPEYLAVYSGLNSRAREAVCAAQEEALRRRHYHMDTDHLLLGLLCVPQCTASRILERFHVTAEQLSRELAPQADTLEHSDGKEGLLPLTHRARRVLVMAEMEAHRFGKTFIGTEHLLLGLLLIGTGPAASALFEAGLTVDGVRREVIVAGK